MRITVSMLAWVAALGLYTHAVEAQEATPQPSVPAMISEAGAAPFWVDGIVRTSVDGGVGLHVASDGQRQICAIFDLRDNTPVYFSNSHETLIYDLPANRIVRVPLSRAAVSVDWNASSPRPLSFAMGVYLCPNEQALAKVQSLFRADRFLAASGASLAVPDPGDNARLFRAKRPNGCVEAVEIPYPSGDWFRFTSLDQGGFYRIELEAHTKREVPPDAMAFPDVAALREDVNVVDYNETLMPGFVMFLKSGRASLEKMALAGDDAVRKTLHKSLGSPDWDQLRQQDEKLGAAYRAALAKQGIRFRARARVLATQPAK